MLMSICITGATGFVGKELVKSHLVTHILGRENVPGNHMYFPIETIDGSTDFSQLFRDVSFQCLVHLAGVAHKKDVYSTELFNINTDGTLNLARQAANAGLKRFVFVSSIGVLGQFSFNNPFNYTDAPYCHNAYTLSKYNAEVGLRKIAEDTGMEVVIVRPTLVYGVNAPGNFGLLTKIVHKSPILPFYLVNNKRDFISVQNLSDLLLTCAVHPDSAGHTFLASDMETVSIKEFTDAIAKGLGKKIIQLPIPVFLMRFAGKLIGQSEMVEQLVGNLQVNTSNISKVLGWKPPLSIEESMVSLLTVKNREKK